jgi:hypothetical protein
VGVECADGKGAVVSLKFSSTAESSEAVAAAPSMSGESPWFLVRKVISFPALMAVLLTGVALLSAESRLIDPDTWWHVKVGEQILATHALPTTDTYSFTAAGTAWMAYEWLGEVLLALAARTGGLWGLLIFQRVIVVIVAGVLYYLAYVRSGNAKAACIASAIVLPIAPVAFTLRPQMIGYVFLLVTVICLEHFRNGSSKALWFLPPLFVVWVNTHGTFVFGLFVIGLYWVTSLFKFKIGGLVAEGMDARRCTQLLLAFLLCLLALLVTPYGSKLAAYPIEMATAQPLNIANIQEWQPLSLANPVGVYLLIFAMGLFVAQVTLRLSYRLVDMILLLFVLYAACAHLRFAMLFVIFLIPVVAEIFARWTPPYDPSKDRYVLNFALMVIAVVAVVKLQPTRQALDSLVSKDYPAGAVDYLRNHPYPTGMFNEYGWGGYLIWQLGPEHKVFIDGRADVYEYSGVLPDYMVIAGAQADAMRTLARRDVRSCLVNRTGALAQLLAANGWRQIYSDDLAAIFLNPAKPAEQPGR